MGSTGKIFILDTNRQLSSIDRSIQLTFRGPLYTDYDQQSKRRQNSKRQELSSNRVSNEHSKHAIASEMVMLNSIVGRSTSMRFEQ